MNWLEKVTLAEKYRNIPSSELTSHLSNEKTLKIILEVRETYKNK